MSGPLGEALNPGEPEGLPEDLFTNPAKYDGDIPLWRRTVGLVKQYQTVRPNNRGKLLDQFAEPLVRNLGGISQALENLDLITLIKPGEGIETIQGMLGLHLESAVSRRANLSSWTPEKIDELIRLGLDSSERTAPLIERIKTALFNAPQTVGEAVDLFYNAAWAMVETPDPAVREEIFAILCFEKPVLTENSVSSIAHLSGTYSADDDHLRKYSATRFALKEVGRLLEMPDNYNKSADEILEGISQRYEVADSKLADALMHPQNQSVAKKLMDSQINKNPSRSKKLDEFWENYNDDTSQAIANMMDLGIPMEEAAFRYYDEVAKRPWPENVVKDLNDPLRSTVLEYLHKFIFKTFWEHEKSNLIARGYKSLLPHSMALTEHLVIGDILAFDCDTPEQKNAIIKRVFNAIIAKQESTINTSRRDAYVGSMSSDAFAFFNGQICSFGDNEIFWNVMTTLTEGEIGRLSSIIEYHRPTISLEQLDAIGSQLTSIRSDLRNKFTRSVGKRGFDLLIADSSLKQLGYERISFQQSPGGGIDATIRFNDIPDTYEFLLDSDYRIVIGKDIQRFVSPQDQAWLELLTLSHLKKVICTGADEEDTIPELVGGKAQYENLKRQMVHSSEHLRWYKGSKRKYTQEAFEKCLKSGLPIKNLHTINQMRARIGWGGTAETGWWTYVKGAEMDIDTMSSKPVRVSYSTAADVIREALPLEEISTEEKDRIEKEILAELEI